MKLPTFLNKESLPFLLLGVAPLPFFVFISLFFMKMQHLELCDLRLKELEEKALQLSFQKQKEDEILAKIKKSESGYVERNLENFSLSSGRLDSDNLFSFTEETPRRSSLVEEVELKQKQPVFLNEEELKRTLSRIEAVSIGSYHPEEGSPQLLIKNFDLTKKMNPADEEVYEVMLQIIKREPLRN